MSDRQTMARQATGSNQTADRQWTAVCLLSFCCLAIVCLSDTSLLTSLGRTVDFTCTCTWSLVRNTYAVYQQL